MGILEAAGNHLNLYASVIIYGHSATEALALQIAEEIETMWNEPNGAVTLNGDKYLLRFYIKGFYEPGLQPDDVYYNTNPENNYFRIEDYAQGNISFVDGLGSNTGYFLLENLFKGSTTAAHEYGHTLGLEHPEQLDIRGQGTPGIMYPRGTLVDAQYQYDPGKPAGEKGGTIYTVHRRVLQHDIDNLRIHRLRFEQNKAVIGEFSSIWHNAHNRPEAIA